MKRVDCIINGLKLENCKAILREYGIQGMTIAEVRAIGGIWTPDGVLCKPNPKLRVSFHTDDAKRDAIVTALKRLSTETTVAA